MKLQISSLIHYLIVFLVLWLSWIPIMNYFSNNLLLTSITAFLVFVISDQLVHIFVLGEKPSLIK